MYISVIFGIVSYSGVEEEPVHAGHGVLQPVLALAEVRAALALGEQTVLNTVVVGAARGRW